jgi:glycosyltransferase involved in cell wall biosynthesis
MINLDKISYIHVYKYHCLRLGGGESRFVLRLWQEQKKQNAQAFLFPTKYKNIDKTKQGWDFENNSHNIITSFKNLLLICRKKNNVLFFFHNIWNFSAWPVFIFCIILNYKFIILPHGSLEKEGLSHKSLPKNIFLLLFLNYIISQAQALFSTSSKETESIRKKYPQSFIYEIGIGVDFAPKVLKNLRKKEKEIKIITYLARIEFQKGIEELISAWNKIENKYGWELHIAGDGNKKYTNKLFSINNKYCDIIYHGYLNDVEKSKLLMKSDIFVLPSHSESFGLAIAEALTFQIPVITTNKTPWVKDKDISGVFIFEAGNSNELKSHLIQLMQTDETDRIRIGQKGASFVESNFSWESVAKKSLLFESKKI